MERVFDSDERRAIRVALARSAYAQGKFRLVLADLQGSWWLVTTHRGLYAVSPDRIELVAHGWFFGLDRHADQVYLFENCGLRDREANLGRILRFDWDGQHLANPAVLVTGIHGNAHHLKIIGGLICLVDTANQRILRYTLDGAVVDIKEPLPRAPATDTSGAYHHINCLAAIDGRIALMLHNGKAPQPRKSELVWLDPDWNLTDRHPIDGYQCHDIVPDAQGVLWHCASQTGELVSDTGRRCKISDTLMTRALAFCQGHLLVGLSTFGDRQVRDALAGEAVILDSAGNTVARHELPAGPADAVALR
jgi:hypothetical protein